MKDEGRGKKQEKANISDAFFLASPPFLLLASTRSLTGFVLRETGTAAESGHSKITTNGFSPGEFQSSPADKDQSGGSADR